MAARRQSNPSLFWTAPAPVVSVSDDTLPQVPTFMEWGVGGEEFKKETGFEGPGADTAAISGWIWKQDERALTGSNHGKDVPKVPEGRLHGRLTIANSSPTAESG